MNKVELIKAVAEATNNTQKDIKVIMEVPLLNKAVVEAYYYY